MLILTIANVQRLTLARMLEESNIPATVLSSLGTAAPWPIESGATAIICGTDRAGVESFARKVCRDRGEQCAMLVEIPGATFDFLSPEG